MPKVNNVIHLLPDSLANQIAAGEVIQRPASIVKELMENALDAGSTEIRLILKDSGKTMIQVVDNGKGMSEPDARLAFERHATSKIQESEDLFNIRSFGFRGEALASIAAVAHVDLKTKQASDELGTHVVMEGSVVKKQEPISHPAGTTFTIRNLFFNVPARRKFLKSDPVELKHILEEFARVALPHPEIFFSVYHNDNELYHFPKGNLRQRLSNYFGKTANENIVPIGEQSDFINISGFVGKPKLIKKSRGDQYIFVNHRFIKSHYLAHAIKIAYENLIPDGYFPFYVVMLEIDPAMIDINIHPTKQEIKFENERLIYNYIKVAVKHALGKYSIAPSLDFEGTDVPSLAGSNTPIRPSSAPEVSTYNSPTGHPAGEKSKWLDFYQEISQVNINRQDAPIDSITLSSDWDKEQEDNFPDTEAQHLNCFQVHESYIISPIKSGWMVIDQSRAHERILYEAQLQGLKERSIGAQTILFPETLQIDARYSGILEGLLEDLKYIGFYIEKFGTNTYVINSTPGEGLRESPSEFIKRFVVNYAENLELEISIEENIARSFASQNKIRKGKRLSLEEMQSLIDQLFACENPYTNPGGNKCFITFGLDEVERRFNN